MAVGDFLERDGAHVAGRRAPAVTNRGSGGNYMIEGEHIELQLDQGEFVIRRSSMNTLWVWLAIGMSGIVGRLELPRYGGHLSIWVNRRR